MIGSGVASLSVAHIGYIVDCIEENTTAFAELYGIDQFDVYEFKPVHAWAYGKEIFDCHFLIAMGVSQNGVNIELIKPITGCDTPHMAFLNRYGSGVHHFSMSVKDLSVWKAYFVSNPKVNVIFEAEVYDNKRGYRRCMYVQKDNACPVIEFAEIPRKRSAAVL